MFYFVVMVRVPDNRLTGLALAVLEDIAAPGRDTPAPQNHAAALALAYLATKAGDRQLFDQFWRYMVVSDKIQRTQNLSRLLNGIYLELGSRRT